MSKPAVGNPLPLVPSYDRNGRINPGWGPRCYLCNRQFRPGEVATWAKIRVCNGHTAESWALGTITERQDNGSAEYMDVALGSACARKYMPSESRILYEQLVPRTAAAPSPLPARGAKGNPCSTFSNSPERLPGADGPEVPC